MSVERSLLLRFHKNPKAVPSRHDFSRVRPSTVFISITEQDKRDFGELQHFLEYTGWRILPIFREINKFKYPTAEEVDLIKMAISQADYFLFLATTPSMSDRWCHWEAGYASAVLPDDRRVLLTTINDGGYLAGNEYRWFYRSISRSKGGGWGVFPNGSSQGTSVHSLNLPSEEDATG